MAELPMRDDLRAGNKFPDFELPDIEGGEHRLSGLLGEYPGVLIFGRGSF
jgi:peroxiredoxin